MGKTKLKAKDKIGRLTLIEVAEPHISKSGRKSKQWLCKCECGAEVVKRSSALSAKKGPKSCGCLIKDKSGAKPKHGGYGTPEYNSWIGMKQRCYYKNDNNVRYKDKCITVCDRWKDSFENFLEDMGPKPDPTYSIDRIDNDGDYTPDNCRWTDKSTQRKNQQRYLEKHLCD